MDQSTAEASTARAIRRLTVAVWVLVSVLLVDAVISASSLLMPYFYVRQMSAALPSAPSRGEIAPVDPFPSFHELPPDKQIQEASVIALTTYKPDGARLKSIVSEILKQKSGTTFYYKVGDEYALGSRYVAEQRQYGDGEVIFFTGSPASMRFSASYANGRIGGMGDMPLQTLRDMIEMQK